MEYIDMDAGLARIRGNKKIYRRMLQLFLQSQEFAAFEDAIAQRDNAKASDVAHAIKGVAGNLSMDRLFHESAELMVQLKQGSADEAMLASYRETLEKTIELTKQIADKLDAEA